MANVLIPLAQGCEELEAVTLIDILRRGGIEVVTAGLTEGQVKASRGTVLVPDVLLDDVLDRDFDMVLLPGGLPGSDYLNEDLRIIRLIQNNVEQQRRVGAICAAPKVLVTAGVLKGRRATAYPGVLSDIAEVAGVAAVSDAIVQDGLVMTSRGPGTALDFALEIVTVLAGQAKREEVEAALVR